IFGSSILFFAGLLFAYIALIPAALNFFINYGSDVVEQSWSIDKYFEFVLLLLFSTGLAFQIPIIQLILGFLGIVSSAQMFAGWRFVVLGSVIMGAVLGLYFGGIGAVKLLGK
ncbi:MAG: twin-arginine translocase subunit TatC, partial [Pleurocapsa sp.]